VAGARNLRFFAQSIGQKTAKKEISPASGRGWGCGKTQKIIYFKKTVREPHSHIYWQLLLIDVFFNTLLNK
jgi:hypothetical protein